VLGAINMVIYAVAGHAMIALMTSIPEVRVAAANYLWWPVLMPLASVWAYTYDGVYLAATRTRIMRNTMIASFMIFLMLLHALLPLIGNAGLWIAVMGFLTGRGLLLHVFFPRVLRTI
jgi:MATE family multidrug resistance protein